MVISNATIDENKHQYIYLYVRVYVRLCCRPDARPTYSSPTPSHHPCGAASAGAPTDPPPPHDGAAIDDPDADDDMVDPTTAPKGDSDFGLHTTTAGFRKDPNQRPFLPPDQYSFVLERFRRPLGRPVCAVGPTAEAPTAAVGPRPLFFLKAGAPLTHPRGKEGGGWWAGVPHRIIFFGLLFWITPGPPLLSGNAIPIFGGWVPVRPLPSGFKKKAWRSPGPRVPRRSPRLRRSGRQRCPPALLPPLPWPTPRPLPPFH